MGAGKAHPLALAAHTKTRRSTTVLRHFAQQQPCPSTGLHQLPCPGYVIDHIKPLACGGEDAPANLQWQTKQEAKDKDRWERKNCQRK